VAEKTRDIAGQAGPVGQDVPAEHQRSRDRGSPAKSEAGGQDQARNGPISLSEARAVQSRVTATLVGMPVPRRQELAAELVTVGLTRPAPAESSSPMTTSASP